jgi:2-polyprenyl-6-methoxyphenol hydroxylase-like FAD-dependent oxidoreductase
MPIRNILVSGAGIAGCTIAYWLLNRGFTPILLERASHFREGGYIIDFWGVGFDVAELMGLIPQLRKAGYLIDHIEFVDRDGKERSSLGGHAFERVLGDRFFSIQRGELAKAIYGAVEHKIETVFGDSIKSITGRPDTLEVAFEHGAPRLFDLVIGTDGVGSSVRKMALPELHNPERYVGYYAASFLTTGYPWRREHTYVSYAAPGRQISRYALREDRTAFLFVFAAPKIEPGLDRDIEAQKKILKEIFSRRPWKEWPEIEERLNACDDLYFSAARQIELPSWGHGRIALVGDEAYCPSLLAGEGTAFAMAGAYILAAELALCGGDYTAAFRAYESRLRPFIQRKQKAARNFASSFAPKTEAGLVVRDIIFRLSAFPAVATFLVRQFVADRYTLPDYPKPAA